MCKNDENFQLLPNLIWKMLSLKGDSAFEQKNFCYGTDIY